MSNSTYEQLMQKYVNAPYSLLLSIAVDSINHVMPIFDQIADDGNGASVVLPFICTALAVDGKFSDLEYQFVKDVTGLTYSYDEFKTVVQNFYSDKWVAATDKLVDACPDEIKQYLISFCLAFVAVDEKISREENAFIYRLIG